MLCDGLNAAKLTASTATLLLLLLLAVVTRVSTWMIVLGIKLKTTNDAMQDVHGCSMGTYPRVA